MQTSFFWGQNLVFKELVWPWKWDQSYQNLIISWKLGQGHQNLIKSLNHPNVTIYEVWPESVICFFQEIECRQAFFGQNLIIQSADVTLKMRSRSPKSNQILKPSQCYNYEVWPESVICFFQEIECRQAFFGQNLIIQSAGVTLKMRSRSPKSNRFFSPPNDVSVQVWSKSTWWFRR